MKGAPSPGFGKQAQSGQVKPSETNQPPTISLKLAAHVPAEAVQNVGHTTKEIPSNQDGLAPGSHQQPGPQSVIASGLGSLS